MWVLWRSGRPSPSEIAAVRRVDPRLQRTSAAEAAELLDADDWWEVGPLASADAAAGVEAGLRALGLWVERARP